MCTRSCLDFIATHLTETEAAGRSVLEVGALDVNGSARSLVAALKPGSYLGVDMQEGPGVDEVCPAEKLEGHFGANTFDIVMTTEMLEHVFDWRVVLHNLKQVVKPGGLLLVTTRSFGFGYHAYPYDFWRYETDDMRKLFADFEIIDVINDPLSPGVFVKARKPREFTEAPLQDHALYSMITGRRSIMVDDADIARFHSRRKRKERFRAIEQAVRRVRDFILGRRRAGA